MCIEDFIEDGIKKMLGFIKSNDYKLYIVPEYKEAKITEEMSSSLNDQYVGGYHDMNLKVIGVAESVTKNSRLTYLAILIHECAHMCEWKMLLKNESILYHSVRHDNTDKKRLYFHMRELRVVEIGWYLIRMFGFDAVVDDKILFSEKSWSKWLRNDREEKGFVY